jgi:hypothetical protein
VAQELLVNGRPIEYDRVPVRYMRDGMKLYFENGISPGHFGTALLSNDLMEAFGRADESNREAMFEWVSWLYNYAPAGSYGSPECVSAWIKSRQSEAA